MLLRTRFFSLALCSTLFASCTLSEPGPGEGGLFDEQLGASTAAVTVPSKGSSSTLDIAAWNIEWFGSTSNGPSNETLQRTNVRDVILGTNFDIWGVEEIVSASAFTTLVSELTGYRGLLASDSTVTSGSSYYSSSEQKVGLIYNSSVATVQSARIILTSYDYDFAGRPPLEVKLSVSVNGTTSELIVIVLHAKAGSDSASWQRRVNAANALKSYLDSTYPAKNVIVIGDFNDDVDTSITSGYSSSYQNFVNDPADYEFVTEALSLNGDTSTVSYSDMIDHHLGTNEMSNIYVAGSAQVYRVDQYISSYGTTTSDHYPVLSRWDWSGSGSGGGGGGGGTGPAQVIINEILANEPGSNVDGEFVELVNIGSSTADLSGWKLSDGSGVRHTFPSGTTLAPGKAIVVYGSTASGGTLGLGNSGDTVTVTNGATTVDSYQYASTLAGTDGVSMNRNVDGNAASSFVLHTSISALSSSANARSSGAAW